MNYNAVSFNRKESDTTSCRYVIVCHDGVDDELMEALNSKHSIDKPGYHYAYYDFVDIKMLNEKVRDNGWRLLIIKHICERKHRMDGAPDWVIRNEKGYYFNTYSEILYCGPNIYKEEN